MYLKEFDPWKSRLCICPKKYSLDPYTGCLHGCLYCYATSYVKDFHNPRPKKSFISVLRRNLKSMEESITYVSMSNSSDPYQPLEKEYKLARESLKMFRDYSIPVLILTKSDLIMRDIDILSEMNSVVSITITTTDENLCKVLEPFAPQPSKRIEVLKEFGEVGIPTVVRIDPIIPLLNEDIERVVEEIVDLNVKHLVVSTYKAKYDSFLRISRAFPQFKEIWLELYKKCGSKIGGSWYLPYGLRVEIINKVIELCSKNSISLGICREGIPTLASSCDGSHLFKNKT